MKGTLQRAFLLVILAILVLPSRGDVAVASLFGDGMVLQRDQPLPIWGRAAPGEKITLTFAGQMREATPDHRGRWLVILEPLPASPVGAELTITGRTSITLRDVVVGDVWLCSGQSNMAWPVSRAAHAAQEIAAANFPLLRHVAIGRTTAELPAESVETSGWASATPEMAGSFSAVAYFFARELHRKLGVPVGLVNSSWGGTPIEAWMSPASLAANPAFRVVHERWAQTLTEYPAKRAAFERDFAAWAKSEATAKALGPLQHASFLKNNAQPRPPRGPGDPAAPSGLFNGMINPLLPFGLRGVLWYQGENNVPRAHEYHALFNAMITSWRAHYGQGDLPFFWVNLPAFTYPSDTTGVMAAHLREAQTKTLALPNTGQAVAIDLGNPHDIHPTNKQEVGRRLASLVLRRVHGVVGDDTGPTFVSATPEILPVRSSARGGPRRALRVRFSHGGGGGLIAYHKPVQSLQLAGTDRVFHPAEAMIEGDTLLVSSPAVSNPIAVRYAWSNAPEANLFNGSGLPAVPFRSDNW